MAHDFEFYETPHAFTRWLFAEMEANGTPIQGNVFEPCIGSGAIYNASLGFEGRIDPKRFWISNDLDPRWSATYHADSAVESSWLAPAKLGLDWTVTNPPFTPALAIISHALTYSRIGVAMHLRASIHEVLKTGVRRTWMAQHPPTGILWLPRFAYQRSPTTGLWTTDNVCACWVIWLNGVTDQFIRYAPEWVIDALDAETPAYRRRMDQLIAERPDLARKKKIA